MQKGHVSNFGQFSFFAGSVLSISFEVDVRTGKVDGSLLFFLGGFGGMSPRKILKFR